MDNEKIKIQAKEIMDNFMDALSSIEVEEEFELLRENCYRDEKNLSVLDDEFKQRFLSNAPKTNGNAILANKGAWVE